SLDRDGNCQTWRVYQNRVNPIHEPRIGLHVLQVLDPRHRSRDRSGDVDKVQSFWPFLNPPFLFLCMGWFCRDKESFCEKDLQS
ncbi:unnamed protein product, partial [Mycena citricolor]